VVAVRVVLRGCRAHPHAVRVVGICPLQRPARAGERGDAPLPVEAVVAGGAGAALLLGVGMKPILASVCGQGLRQRSAV
jgi:hypothetical protein